MILVDTNVWSEAFRARPDETVSRWARQNAERLWLSTVVLGELLSGVELMPSGQKRSTLQQAYAELIHSYQDRIAPFDLAAAQRYGPILAQLERAGRNPGTADAQIAATASARGMILATRNLKHFADLGLRLVDPWQA